MIVTKTPTNANGYKTVGEALAAALETDGTGVLADILSDVREKLAVGPKNVDLTIASIGMTPEKFTDKGGASVTADVLRKLAGEPFGDEPKYGTVRRWGACLCPWATIPIVFIPHVHHHPLQMLYSRHFLFFVLNTVPIIIITPPTYNPLNT